VLKDPVSHWIEHDCWQPPSLPSYTFRSGKTFGGPAGFRRPNKDADAKRRTAAYWFVHHNRVGDAMLHHRTLNPVVIRDWSTKMETFTSALALTAATSTASHNALSLDRPQTPKAFKEFAFHVVVPTASSAIDLPLDRVRARSLARTRPPAAHRWPPAPCP
jgi:hypothetical protein